MSTHEIDQSGSPADPSAAVEDPVAAADAAIVAADVRVDQLTGRLRRRHRRFVFPALAVSYLWYELFMFSAAYAKGSWLNNTWYGSLNWWLLFAFSQFAVTFAIAYAYKVYANKEMDPLAAEIRDEVAHASSLVSGQASEVNR